MVNNKLTKNRRNRQGGQSAAMGRIIGERRTVMAFKTKSQYALPVSTKTKGQYSLPVKAKPKGVPQGKQSMTQSMKEEGLV